jgi:Pyridoxamine 5'-phosphate oxidase
MSTTEHAYIPPRTTATKTAPAEVARYLDGTDLSAKTQALRLSTVDTEGWPHAALLSAGDMIVTSSGRIRFGIFPQSATAANLARDGRLTLTLALDGGLWELQLRARPLARSTRDVPLAFFEAEVEATRTHVASDASLTSGITFALHDPEAVQDRWRRQIAALRSVA